MSRGWHNESHRHSLASHGIRSKAVVNPVAHEKWFDSSIYGSGTKKGHRKFRGSGLNGVEIEEIIEYLEKFRKYVSLISRNEGLDYDFKIREVYLVGSRVSGFYNEDSDLDIIVYMSDEWRRLDPEFRSEIEDIIVVAGQWIEEKPSIMIDGKETHLDIHWAWEDYPFSDDDILYEPYIKIWGN